MFNITNFLLKSLYVLMADESNSSDDFESILFFLANNQLPDLICETLVELMCFGVVFALIWMLVAISELNDTSGSHCNFVTTHGCPVKMIQSYA